jgi:hypothetical protein
MHIWLVKRSYGGHGLNALEGRSMSWPECVGTSRERMTHDGGQLLLIDGLVDGFHDSKDVLHLQELEEPANERSMQDDRLAAEAFRVAMFVQTEQLRHAGRIQIGHVAKINDDVGLAGQALEFLAPSLPTTYVVFTRKND